ncbi:MAG: cytochrome ubiquinol oxidase subunit I [Verrucomicrobia bacterium]|nr:cytochrome ubiquinol oxidase subunit I [Verrucomicrobiota bacterium]
MDVVFLSRIQFALTSMFHYIYPPLSIGLGLFLVIIEGIYIKTKNPVYLEMTKFWVKIFALTFALGVATGLVQLFGFGTNWGRYSNFVGDVFGSALGAEGIFAFFLEAGFMGVMLFGWKKVSAKMHYFSTICVAAGAHFSAIWIVIANSWMQTPAGFRIEGTGLEARAVVTDFWQMLFNPSSVDRLIHVILGCWLSGIFLVISIVAYYLLKKRHLEFSRFTMKIALIMAAIVLVLQFISADSSATGVAVHQPSKLAAMEGIFETTEYAPMAIIGWVDTETQTVKGLKIPGLLSFLVHRDFKTPVTGFNEIPVDERPPIQITFQAYHMMIYMWGLMVLGAAAGLYLMRKNKLENAKWVLRFLVISVAFPQIANQVGWMTAEIGRQPWIVWKMLRTTHGVSPGIVADQVLASLIMLAVIYCGLLAVFLTLLDKKIKHGPSAEGEAAPVFSDPFKESQP